MLSSIRWLRGLAAGCVARSGPTAAVLLLGMLVRREAMAQTHALTISAEATHGEYQDDVSHQSTSSRILCTFCGSGYSVQRMGYYHGYTLAGGNAAYQLRPASAYGIQAIGLGLRAGHQQVGFRPLAPEAPFNTSPAAASARLRLYDFNPYLAGRLRLGRMAVGYRAGLHLGQLRYTATVAADSTLDNEWLAPDAQLWVGVRRVLFAQFDSGLGQLALGNHTSRFGLGTGLGADDGRYLLAGLALARHEPGYGMCFLGANIPLGRSGLVLEPYYATDLGRHNSFSLKMNYRINR